MFRRASQLVLLIALLSQNRVSADANQISTGLDINFRPERVIHSSPFLILPDRSIITVGFPDNFLARIGLPALLHLAPDGSVEPSFGSIFLDSTLFNNTTRIVQISGLSDQSILIFGFENDLFAFDRARFARISHEGKLLPFALPGKFDSVYRATPLRDGEILIFGAFGLARLFADGTEDLSFSAAIPIPDVPPCCLLSPDDPISMGFAQTSSGEVIFAATYLTEGNFSHGIVKLRDNGAIDQSFAPQADYSGGPVRVGAHDEILFFSQDGLVGLLPNGSLDPSFGPIFAGLKIFDTFPDGSIVVLTEGDGDGSRLRKFDANGQTYSDFAARFWGVPSAIHAEPNGDVFLSVGGLLNAPWMYVNGTVISSFCRVLANPPRSRFVVQPADPFFLYPEILRASVLARDPVALEFGSAVALRLQRQGENGAPARIRYRTRDGNQSAKAGNDYIETHGLVEFAPFENEKVITIPIINDSLIEGDESFNVEFTDPVGFEIVQERVTVTIRDNTAASGPLRLRMEMKQEPSAPPTFTICFRNLLQGFTYDLWYSDDLITWIASSIQIDTSTGEFTFPNIDGHLRAHVFWRVTGHQSFNFGN